MRNIIRKGYIWNVRKCLKRIVDIKRKRITNVLISAPCSTKYLTNSSECLLIAIVNGLAFTAKLYDEIMMNLKWKEEL